MLLRRRQVEEGDFLGTSLMYTFLFLHVQLTFPSLGSALARIEPVVTKQLNQSQF